MILVKNQHSTLSIVRCKVLRTIIILLLLALALSLIEKQASNLKPNDFIRYWASARLLLNGENPYDAERLFAVQTTGGYTGQEIISLYNPPWIFPIIVPFSIYEREFSQLLWLLFGVATVLLCSNKVWLYLDGRSGPSWLAWLLAFTFGPTFAALGYTGQITPILLLGFTGFILLIDQPNKDWWVGIFILFIALKPQVSYLFLIILFLWLIYQRRWKLIFRIITTLLLASLLGMFFDGKVILHFLQNLTENTPVAWATPTIGTYLRYYFGFKGFWVQFIPPAITTIISIIFWWRHRDKWNWQTNLPWILFITLITSPYTWTYDFIFLIIPLLIGLYTLIEQIPSWRANLMVVVYIIINGAYWWLHLRYSDFYFIWFAPALFIWYIMVRAIFRPRNNNAMQPIINQKSSTSQ